MDALDVAIKTEGRRIQKEIDKKQAERMSHVDIPKFRRINIKERIRQFYAKILTGFKNKKGDLKLPYSHFTGNTKEEKIACFLPLLYLSNNSRIWLEQEKHYDEIWLYLYDVFVKSFPEHDKTLMDEEQELEEIPSEMMEKIEDFEEAIEEASEELKKEIKDDKTNSVEKINSSFENPLNNLISEQKNTFM